MKLQFLPEASAELCEAADYYIGKTDSHRRAAKRRGPEQELLPGLRRA